MAEFTLDLSSIVDELDDDISETIVRRFALGVYTRVQKRSPVDTGLFRHSWRASVDAPDETMQSGGSSAGLGAVDSAALSDATSSIEGFSILNNKSIYITNVQPYANKLEEGSSSQAPSGVAGISLREEAEAFNQYGGN